MKQKCLNTKEDEKGIAGQARNDMPFRMKKISISGVGSCLVDCLYNKIDFQSDIFTNYLSRNTGDGGLTPGHLVFKEELEKFSSKDLPTILQELTGGRPPEKLSVGGPGIVSVIHAAQMTEGKDITFHYYACGGQDEDGSFLLSALKKTPINIEHYHLLKDASTPVDIVLSDPSYDNGNGERIFVLSMGAAWDYTSDCLDEAFFDSDIVVFGATALVPAIHDNLEELLAKSKAKGCFTIVNTVFDFRSENTRPGQRWNLGKTDKSYNYIDLLITDADEALHLSGKVTLPEAMNFFKEQGAGAVVITNGARDIHLYSAGKLFTEITHATMPISEAVTKDLKKGHSGDTTGCGDNFAGGMIASVAMQLQGGVGVGRTLPLRPLDLTEACCWGVASGGYACFYVGGTWFEEYSGEKRELITPYYERYKEQLNFLGYGNNQNCNKETIICNKITTGIICDNTVIVFSLFFEIQIRIKQKNRK
jgi:sugar/nucleoside kinase (ribokinase family)